MTDVRRGQAQRAAARRFKVSLAVVQYWLARTAGRDLNLVDWSDRPSRPHHHPRQTRPAVERRIIAARRALQNSALGFVGAVTIAQTLAPVLGKKLPSLRTIGRVLHRHGLLDGPPASAPPAAAAGLVSAAGGPKARRAGRL